MHDFGIKYNTKDDANHLLNYLHSLYDITTDWADTLYIGFSLLWGSIHRIVCLFMSGYVERALHRFCVPVPPNTQHSPINGSHRNMEKRSK